MNRAWVKIALVNSLLLFLSSIFIGLILNLRSTGRLYRIPSLSLSNCVKYPVDPVFGFRENACADPLNVIGLTKEYPIDTNLFANNKSSREVLDVLVLGGSVASHLSSLVSFEKILQANLDSRLRTSDSIRFKTVRVFNAAQGGAKQPQGLQAYQSLKMLGYNFDAVIELSGYNEIALNIGENFYNNISPIYPRLASLRFRDSARSLTRTAPQAVWDNLISLHPLHQFLTQNTQLYPFLDAYVFGKDERPRVSGLVGFNYHLPSTKEKAYNLAKQIYVESVKNISLIASNDNIPYIFALQPVQYVQGSKPLTQQERLLICDESNEKIQYRLLKDVSWCRRTGDAARQYYPLLRIDDFAGGDSLRATDLRPIFSNNQNTIYNDRCCHMNSYGMTIIANRLSRVLLDNLR